MPVGFVPPCLPTKAPQPPSGDIARKNGERVRLYSRPGNDLTTRFPDGKRIVTASNDRTARVWDASTGELLRSLMGHRDSINSAAFSLDGARIVTASGDKTARMWDTGSGEMLRELKGHHGTIFSAEFSPDGSESSPPLMIEPRRYGM
jgi:WD40 repeat protein